MKAFAILSADGLTYRHRKGDWSAVFPIEKLGDWIATYEGLRDKKGRFGDDRYAHYDASVQALRKLWIRVYGAEYPQRLTERPEDGVCASGGNQRAQEPQRPPAARSVAPERCGNRTQRTDQRQGSLL